MRNPLLFLLILSFGFSSCLLFKGHFTPDGSAWIWNKDPNGTYNAHNPLQLEKANAWVDTVLSIPALKKLKIETISNKLDHYEINDSIMFFDLKKQELANYHSYQTFAKRLNTEPELLKRVVLDFDKLALNRFYKEDAFLAFTTVSYLNYSQGYFYFIDTIAGSKINTGDTLDFRSNQDFKNFREGTTNRFVIGKKYNDHWMEWVMRR